LFIGARSSWLERVAVVSPLGPGFPPGVDVVERHGSDVSEPLGQVVQIEPNAKSGHLDANVQYDFPQAAMPVSSTADNFVRGLVKSHLAGSSGASTRWTTIND
jgi:hypothetical protein